MELSRHLRDFSKTISTKVQLVVSAFAQALEVIPRQLADNAGFDSTDIVNDLRAKHARGVYALNKYMCMCMYVHLSACMCLYVRPYACMWVGVMLFGGGARSEGRGIILSWFISVCCRFDICFVSLWPVCCAVIWRAVHVSRPSMVRCGH